MNKVGFVVGRLSRVDLMKLIEDCTDSQMRKALLNWLIGLSGAETLVVAMPLRSAKVDKLESKISNITSQWHQENKDIESINGDSS